MPAKRANPPKKLHSTPDFVCENSSRPEIEARHRPTDDEMPLPDSASLLLWILVLGLLLGAAAKSDGEIEEEEEERASGNKKKSGKLCELANLTIRNFDKRLKKTKPSKSCELYRDLCSALFKDFSLTFCACSQHLQHCEVRARNIRFGIVDILLSFYIFLLRFRNGPCFPGGALNGTCYTMAECDQRGGTNGGTCAGGFGVCCISEQTTQCFLYCGAIWELSIWLFLASWQSRSVAGECPARTAPTLTVIPTPWQEVARPSYVLAVTTYAR